MTGMLGQAATMTQPMVTSTKVVAPSETPPNISPDISEQMRQVQEPVIDDNVKGMFLSVENSSHPTTNFLALERSTFKDLQARGRVDKKIKWNELTDPEIYNKVAEGYINDLRKTFDIPTIEEAVLWSYRPGYYKQYGGDIEKIPDDKKGSFGKSAKAVMRQRKQWLDLYLNSLKEQQ